MTKLSERKVSWFTGFHPNVGKAFAVSASYTYIYEECLGKPLLN